MGAIMNNSSQLAPQGVLHTEVEDQPIGRRVWVTPDYKAIELRKAQIGASFGGSDGAGSAD